MAPEAPPRGMIVSGPFRGYPGGDDDSTVTALPLRATPARMPDPTTIPPRPWLYGKYLMRGFFSLLISPGGVGKTQLAMTMATSVALGRGLLGHYVHHQAPAWLLNLEDPRDEMERRLAAIMLHHCLVPDDLEGRLYMDSGRDRRLCIAQVDEDGRTIVYPDQEAIVREARDHGMGLIVVDPLIRSHALDENSNPHMDAAARAWAEVGTAAGCAVLGVHHTRKGAVTDIDAARGGSALKDAARMAMILTPMAADEGEKFGVPEADRWRHVRLDDGKANMAPPDKAEWLRMCPVELGNATDDYPHGDTVTALERWTPPAAAGDASMAQVIAVLEAIQAGPGEGELYSLSSRGRSNARWVGLVVMERMGMERGRALRLVDCWAAAGLLLETEYRSPARRELVGGVRVDANKLNDMRAGAWEPPEYDV